MKLLRYILYVGVLLMACEAEQNNPLVIASCSDKIKNQDETDVDCGGKCTACKVVLVSPCTSSLVNNRITYKSTNINFTSNDVSFDDESFGTEFTIWKNNMVIIVDLYGSLPTQDTLFPVSASYVKPGYASIWVSEYDQYSTSGNVYVLYSGGKWIIEFCSISLKSSSGSVSNTISGRIVY